jgi:predicted RND superfamily exporter protein
MPSLQVRFASSVERGLGHAAMVAWRHPFVTLLLTGLLTLVAAWAGQGLTVDSDFENLLPESFPSVQGLAVLEKRFGGVGYVTIVGRDAKPEQLERFAADVTPKLEALPTIRFVKARRPFAAMEDKAGYFLDVDDLRVVYDRIEAREKYERRRNNPMYVDLGMDEAPSLDFADIEQKYRQRLTRKGFDLEGVEARSSYYLDPERRMIALFAKPTQLAKDFAFDQRVKADVEGVLAGMDLSAYGPRFKVELTGSYVKKVVMQQRVLRDVALTSAIGTVLMLLLMLGQFRSLVPIVLILVPMSVATTGMFGVAGATFGKLSMLGAFVGVILLGLGVDGGIHLVGRFRAALADGLSKEEALRTTFVQTGRAVVIASVTTVFGLGGLSVSAFKAFREFGTIASLGMALITLGYAVVLPALLRVADLCRWKAAFRGRTHKSWMARGLGRAAVPVVVVATLLVPLVAWGARAVRFDNDFRTMEGRDRTHLLDEVVDEIVGYSNSPIVVLTDTACDEQAATEELRRRMRELGTQTRIDFVASLSDFVPPDQPAKQVELLRIQQVLQRVKPSWLKDDRERDFLDRALRIASAEPFGRADLPVEIRRQFSGMEDNAGFVLVFPAIRTSDGGEVMKLGREVRSIRIGEGRSLDASGEPMILADILELLLDEAPVVLGLTLLLVFLALWVFADTWHDALPSFFAALATLAVLFAVLPLAGLQLNYLNVMLIPILFGSSVEASVHLIEESRHKGAIQPALAEAGPLSSGSLLTNFIGFGAMVFASHEALQGFGEVAVVGIAGNALICLVLVPSALVLIERWRERRAAR